MHAEAPAVLPQLAHAVQGHDAALPLPLACARLALLRQNLYVCTSEESNQRTGARVAPGSVTLDAAAARCGYSLYLLY